MSSDHIIALLIKERDKLDLAIEALTGSEQRRGRPSSETHAVAADTETAFSVAPLPSISGKRERTFTAQRKAQAEKMKLYWAVKRKKEAKP